MSKSCDPFVLKRNDYLKKKKMLGLSFVSVGKSKLKHIFHSSISVLKYMKN